MFTKWTKKESLKAVICFVVFFAGVLATQLPGYLSPLYWAIYPVFAAFVAAGPLTCMMDMKPGFGSAAIFPVLWFIVYRCMGELGMPVMWVICFTFIIAAEIIRKLMGYSNPGSIRVSVPVACLSAGCMVFPLYVSKSAFIARAAAEMDASYVAGLDKYGTVLMFIIVIALSIVMASVSERLTERIIAGRKNSGDIYVKQ